MRLALARVDARRKVELRANIEDAGIDLPDAERLATMGVALLIGAQQLRHPVDIQVVRAVFDEFRRVFAGNAGRSRPTDGPLSSSPS